VAGGASLTLRPLRFFWGARKQRSVRRVHRPMATTPVAPEPAPTAHAAPVSVAVIAVEPFAARRIRAALKSAGMDRTDEAPGVAEFLSKCVGPHPDAVVFACNPYEPASLAAIRRLADALRTTYLVVVSSASDGAGLSQALNAGADGVVFEKDLESTLGPVTQSVLVGQISLPRRFHRCVVKPVFSHREKEVLTMVVQGLGNRQIANRLFLAESTVKSHLSTAFQKLGVRSRKEAAALLMDPEEGLEAVLSIEAEESLYADVGAVGR
jgi:DNA-binding NarL/FixJ family response regulator